MTAAEYRLGAGTLSAATLNGSSGYLIENFAVQSDQYSALWRPWGPPADDDQMYPRYAVYPLTMDSGQGQQGFVQFDWLMAYWTEAMISYFESTFLGSAGSALVTVKTMKHTGSFQVYNATVLLPVPGENFKPSDRGAEGYRIRFRAGVAIS